MPAAAAGDFFGVPAFSATFVAEPVPVDDLGVLGDFLPPLGEAGFLEPFGEDPFPAGETPEAAATAAAVLIVGGVALGFGSAALPLGDFAAAEAAVDEDVTPTSC